MGSSGMMNSDEVSMGSREQSGVAACQYMRQNRWSEPMSRLQTLQVNCKPSGFNLELMSLHWWIH